MRKFIEKIIYVVFTILIFIVFWKITGKVWEEFVPLNYKTNLIGLIFVSPIIIILSFVLSSLTFHFIRKSD
ncbi:inhibitor of the pro-sigma K processing machinery [Saliterribacillus persicus]|uniref:Inhibitor of the pro-sigma K processing machinery n=1 Tax=Saliterribacillus persicus TaxID=930114 RepID=A0A368YB75_9BACI|nr:inhibitor of the pro-sigma K processing machinery [Saliterribacillus persicus]